MGLARKKRKSAFPSVIAALALGAAFPAAALKVPLSNSGTCPELARSPMPSPPRFQSGPADIAIRKFPNTMQVSLTPEQSINCATAPEPFKVEQWASEADVGNIKALQAFTFDERGRVWAVETFDYPNIIKEPFAGGDRVVILEDTDGDKVMDKHTVFVSGLNIPQGIEIVPQGIVVAMAPHLVLFTDKDGNDKADVPMGQVLYTGFNKNDPGDTHGGITHIKYGIDGWLYGVVGYNGGSVKGVTFTQALWRCRLDGSKFEVLGKLGNNSAGIGISEEGEVFGSSANNDHTFHVAIPGAGALKGISAYGQSYKPITRDICQGDWIGNYTAASNHEIYSARLFPKEYWNRAALICEGTGHLVAVDFLKRKGSTWEATRVDATPNLFASTDAWSAPVQAKTGPDGAVWVLDWFNYLFLHNGEPPEGAGHAYISDLRTKKGSRIYRVVPKDGKVDAMPNLATASTAQLVAALGHSNMHWRSSAQKLILRKTYTADEKAALETLLLNTLKNRTKDEVDNDPAYVHALWTAKELGLFEAAASKWDSVLKAGLLHPAAGARMNVAKAMPLTAASSAAIKAQGTVNDPDAHVRIQALLALANNGNKAAGAQMWVDYRNLDEYSKTAFTKAGIDESPTLVVPKPLDPVVGIPAPVPAAPTRGLRFAIGADGAWFPLPDGRLDAGSLRYLDARGRTLGSRSWDGSRWSPAPAGIRGARLYAFSSGATVTHQGMLPLAVSR
jgi:putative membrane-bound dehydrogenase-like protein